MSQDKHAEKKSFWTRRKIIVGAAGLGGLAYVGSKKPRDLSGPKDAYFDDMRAAVADAGIGKPTLIIDKQRLLTNIDMVTSHIPTAMALRIAQKSVPSMGLLNTILSRAKTNRLMVFNKDYLQTLSLNETYHHILLGKPLPIMAARNFYSFIENRTSNPETVGDIEWLIDTPQRLEEYTDLADAQTIPMKLNIELDVGMHRGGVTDLTVLAEMLKRIKDHPQLTFKGYMGYEKHIVYAMGGESGREKTKNACWSSYRQAVDVAKEVLGSDFDPATATLNGGGSATYRLYEDTDTINDICLGSAFVMPSHFDYDTLAEHVPAAYITTPVLKQSDSLNLPGGGMLNDILMAWDPNKRQSFFHYGGRWLADPVYPKGIIHNKLYGHSSNQEGVLGSKNIDLKPNDHIIFRPQESENVFLQFGDIAVFEDGKITEFWPVLQTAP